MKIQDQPMDFRPREKMLRSGAENLSLEELLAIIISSGTKNKNALEVGKDIVTKFKNNLSEISLEKLCTISGLGKIKALKLKAALEIGRRFAPGVIQKQIINTSKEAYLTVLEFADKKKEHLLLLTLNARNELISKKVITIGILDASLFHPREIFIESILDSASKIIIIHNHPSGSLEPSQSDLKMIEKIKEAGRILDINLVDSLIISKYGYRSII